MNFHRKALSGSALIVLAVLFVASLLVINSLLRGARVDLTQNQLYTLSDGTRRIISSLDEPIHLYLFYSDKGTQNLPQLRNYYTRVRELLDEMAARSGGKITLDVIDPLPFSEDEDRAAALGLQAVPSGSAGETVFFGLAGTNSTNGQASIPFLQPDKEAFLEYDVAKLIHELGEHAKPVVGLVSSLPLAAGFDPTTRQMQEPWAVYQQLQQLFDVRTLNAASLTTIDKEIGVLMLVHPKQLSDDAQYAIDQFVLRGGHLLVFVDPDAELDDSGADPNDPQAVLADKSSDLPILFKAWGVHYDPGRVVLDRARALQISMGAGQVPIRHPGILGLTAQDRSGDDVITSSLTSINVSSAGYFELAADAPTRLLPLLQSSADAMSVPVDRLRMLADPNALYSGFQPNGEHYVIAARLSGKLQSAFPDRNEAGHLAASDTDSQIVLVADSDILSDRLWVQLQAFFGQKIMNAFANNADFVVNAVDNLAGSSDLISIRGRATSQRPFTTVDALRRDADNQFRDKEQELQQELTDTERKLVELQSAKSQDEALIVSPEQKAELDKFLQRKLEIRKELRQVRRSLDAEIEALGSKIKLINIVLMPALVTLAALLFAWWRNRRRREAARGAMP